ncbi:MAG: hypothetical protein OEZ34_03760 [Spirochaetia bacterium]|nr:hypothetical protein [Spirochaetia bacterium]
MFNTKEKAIKELPLLAEELGLKYIPGDTFMRDFGKIQGIYEDYQLEIDPHTGDHKRFMFTLKNKTGPCRICSFSSPYNPLNDNLKTFDCAYAPFNRYFKTRYANDKLAELFEKPDSDFRMMVRMIVKWGWWIPGALEKQDGSMCIEDNKLCFSETNPKKPAVLTAKKIKQILPQLHLAAMTVDKILSGD